MLPPLVLLSLCEVNGSHKIMLTDFKTSGILTIGAGIHGATDLFETSLRPITPPHGKKVISTRGQ